QAVTILFYTSSLPDALPIFPLQSCNPGSTVLWPLDVTLCAVCHRERRFPNMARPPADPEYLHLVGRRPRPSRAVKEQPEEHAASDRKSTRLNSSHERTSYAV